MVDYRQVHDWLEKSKAERDSRAAYQREARAQVAVQMEYVTRSKEWNVYLEHLQAMLEADENEAKGLVGRLESSVLSDPIEVNRIRLRILELRGQINARKADMALPGQLIEAGKTA